MSRLSRLGDKTFKREIAVSTGVSWLGTFLYLVLWAPPDRIIALTPLVNGTALPILAFCAAAAGIHYMKPKPPPDAAP